MRLRAQTTFEETTLPFSSGVLTQRATVEVQHDLRRNLSLIAALTVHETDYRGVQLRGKGLIRAPGDGLGLRIPWLLSSG